jgi:hypothetical protein
VDKQYHNKYIAYIHETTDHDAEKSDPQHPQNSSKMASHLRPMKHKQTINRKLSFTGSPAPMTREQWPNWPSHFNQIPRTHQTREPNIPTTTKHSIELGKNKDVG